MISTNPRNIPNAMAQIRQVRFKKAAKSANCEVTPFGFRMITGEYREAASDVFCGVSGPCSSAGVSAPDSVGEGGRDSPAATGPRSFVSVIRSPPFGLYCHHRALDRHWRGFLRFLARR